MERCVGLRKIFVYKEKSVAFYSLIYANTSFMYANCMEKNNTLLSEGI
jgi:hypothetical protein